MWFLNEIDTGWTLFLDRDGVINQRKPGGYIQYQEDLVFLPGVLESLYHFGDIFAYIIVVSNQQGVGKGLMTMDELTAVNDCLKDKVEQSHGRIDEIYTCTELEGFDAWCRKPAPGMAYQAQKDFPLIDFSKSIMVGDMESDIIFGKNLGMKTVFVKNSNSGVLQAKADIIVDGLLSLYHLIVSEKKSHY
jgi:histidinol-phosphate phosphatase family protein